MLLQRTLTLSTAHRAVLCSRSACILLISTYFCNERLCCPACQQVEATTSVSLDQAHSLVYFFVLVTCTFTAIMPGSRSLLSFGNPLCIFKNHPSELHAANVSICPATARVLPLQSVRRRLLTHTALSSWSSKGETDFTE